MKQNRENTKRNLKQIAAFAVAVLFLVTSCKKEKNEDMNLLLAVAILSGPNGMATFNFSNTTGLLTARTQNASRFSLLPDTIGQTSGLLTNLAGEDPQAYGDGAGDGFNDKFLTPEAAGIQVCQIVAYKSVDKGGPARGSETLENANFISFKSVAPASPFGDLGPCGSFTTMGITNLSGTVYAGLPIRQIPEVEKANYDRIGLIIRAFSYYFKPSEVPEDAYRYVDLVLNKPLLPNLPGMEGFVMAERGDVSPDIFSPTAPQSFMTSPSFIFPELLPRNEGQGNTSLSESFIDASSGFFLRMPGYQGSQVFGYNLNSPIPPGISYTNSSQKLKFKLPDSATSLKANEPYILIVDLDSTKGTRGNLVFNVSVDNALFWDSTAGDNKFSPQLDAADRPNAISGSDNLTNTARKNMIFHLPTILSETK
ncbi:sigma factor sigX-regulated lipoprotein SrpA [Leptospira stimsonii]|uniref:Lipoprotein n=1 Tax=Leptospira stimsonii TaxID=2202203 RepID=A0ABY2N0A6_9LEPT|nr:hypothetical protein [Leptospira stimsonii]TGK23234.1 hypothetical protein EHO98_05585 [Leptospira stimsonii]TGM12958.1 hypothetical protein EHQ90_14475 [Leptospira stimsonii]